jgi:hypothetical protein
MKSIFTLLIATSSLTLHAQNACTHPKVHEFDFWIGSWIVYKNGTDTVAGYNDIKPVAGGCSLLESYRNANGSYTGNSLNKYNAVTGKWQQFWVDNSGMTLFIEGTYTNNKLIMENQDKNADGTTTNNRITWFKNQDGTVRQYWEQSADKGKTWTVAFDGLYKKNKQ